MQGLLLFAPLIDSRRRRRVGVFLAFGLAFAALALLDELGHTSLLDDLAPRLRDWTSNREIRAVTHPLTRIGAWPESLVIAALLAWLRMKRMSWRAAAPVLAILLSLVVEAIMRLNFAHATLANVWAVLTEQASGDAIRSSFPSGHMTRITILAAFGVPLLAVSAGRRQWIFAAVVVLMAINRLQFSGHTISDLLGGFLLGAMVAWASPLLVRLLARLR